jgi:S1-C subfamily serine protease
VNWLDVAILLVIGLTIMGGWRTGFIRRVFSWAGIIAGVALASWVLPRIVGPVNSNATASRFLLAALVLFLGGTLGQLLGSVIGDRVKHSIPDDRLGRADRILGSAVGVAAVGLLLWVLLPTVADVPGWPSEGVRTSAVASWFDDQLGQPPIALGGLSRSLGLSGLPTVFSALQPSPKPLPPPPDSPLDPKLLDAVERSVVKVSGPSCGLLQSGSGVVVAPGLVATNAHVIAANGSTTVTTQDGERYSATPIAFDPRLDLALLSARSLKRPPLPLSDARVGDFGSALGYAGGGPLTVNSYRISERIKAAGRDIYDSAALTRTIFVMGSTLARGDSGGPLVSPAGEVVGLVFAIAPDRPGVAYGIVGSDVAAMVRSADASRAVSTGPCKG